MQSIRDCRLGNYSYIGNPRLLPNYYLGSDHHLDHAILPKGKLPKGQWCHLRNWRYDNGIGQLYRSWSGDRDCVVIFVATRWGLTLRGCAPYFIPRTKEICVFWFPRPKEISVSPSTICDTVGLLY
jgi:hypothetical protein